MAALRVALLAFLGEGENHAELSLSHHRRRNGRRRRRPRHPRRGCRRRHRARQRGASRTLRSAAAFQRTLERQIARKHLAANRRARVGAASGLPRRGTGPLEKMRARRSGHDLSLREIALSHGRDAAASPRRPRFGPLLPHARRLPPSPLVGPKGTAIRRRRRRFHRFRDRRGAGPLRQKSRDDLPRGRHRRPHVFRRLGLLLERLLSSKRRRSAGRPGSRRGRATPGTMLLKNA